MHQGLSFSQGTWSLQVADLGPGRLRATPLCAHSELRHAGTRELGDSKPSCKKGEGARIGQPFPRGFLAAPQCSITGNEMA